MHLYTVTGRNTGVKMKLVYIEQAIESVKREMEKSQNDATKLTELLIQLSNLKDMKILILEQRVLNSIYKKVS